MKPRPWSDPYPAVLLLSLLALSFASGCPGASDPTDAGSDGDGDGDAGTTADPEDAAGVALVAIYAGIWNVEEVTGTHARGTVTVSEDGSSIDFDTDATFAVNGDNVYNRIPNFLDEPRVQIEFPGTPQERIRIYVDPADLQQPLRFTYYADAASEAPTTDVMVSSP